MSRARNISHPALASRFIDNLTITVRTPPREALAVTKESGPACAPAAATVFLTILTDFTGQLGKKEPNTRAPGANGDPRRAWPHGFGGSDGADPPDSPC
jgi:hypothetical protein